LRKGFGQITITEAVSKEFNKTLPNWIKVINPKSNLHKGLRSILDLGEATSISLALENAGSLLIIDELKGRKIAKQMGLQVTGSLGVLITAKRNNHIKAVKPIIEKIRQTNFRVSNELINSVLEKVNEW
jgi:predicted nucleic acid-binding protein